MKKVSIITLQATRNYGSVLQTLATQKLFCEKKCDVEVINYIRENSKIKNLHKTYTSKGNRMIRILKAVILFPSFLRQKRVFSAFLKKYICLTTRRYSSEAELEKNPPFADVYCVGSDQVWNSSWNGGFLPEFFLRFAPKTKAKISFSSSVGSISFEDDEKELVKKELSTFSKISVREKSAILALKEIGIECAERIIDPTLLISRDVWETMASSRLIKQDYLLVYQLNHNVAFDNYVVNLAKKKKLKIIRVCYRYDQLRLPGKGILLPTVERFLSLLKYSSLIVTDSFHATAFSLNLNKNFVAIYPNKFSSRLHDILVETHCEHKHLIDFSDFEIVDKKIDFAFVNSFLNDEREKASHFLESALGDNKYE